MVLTPHRAVQPDASFIANPRLDIIGERVAGPADLVAEVLGRPALTAALNTRIFLPS
jgi:hypothetical protein